MSGANYRLRDLLKINFQTRKREKPIRSLGAKRRREAINHRPAVGTRESPRAEVQGHHVIDDDLEERKTLNSSFRTRNSFHRRRQKSFWDRGSRKVNKKTTVKHEKRRGA
jgi:hypothetical protein